jgi:hypothetical protein
MSKNPKPTAEELRFVYDLILNGNDDSDILAEYARLFDDAKLMFPYRIDKRFVRERRKELAAAQEVLKDHIAKKIEPVIVQSKKEHFKHLSDIAKVLLTDRLDKINEVKTGDKYEIFRENYETEKLTHSELVGRLEGNIDIAIQKYGAWDIFGCFAPHVAAEYPLDQNLYSYAETNPIEFITIMRTLGQRKTFKGTCPVCKDWR